MILNCGITDKHILTLNLLLVPDDADRDIVRNEDTLLAIRVKSYSSHLKLSCPCLFGDYMSSLTVWISCLIWMLFYIKCAIFNAACR